MVLQAARLWCNFELSIFVKSHGLKNLRLAPLWLTPWLLTTMLLSYVSARLVAVFTEFDPGFVVNTVNATSKFQGVDGTPFAFGLHRISEYVLQSQAYVLFCAPPMLVGLFCFQKKLDGHRDMLESMASFDVRNAKCAVEQDRLFIEALDVQCLQAYPYYKSMKNFSHSFCTDTCIYICMYEYIYIYIYPHTRARRIINTFQIEPFTRACETIPRSHVTQPVVQALLSCCRPDSGHGGHPCVITMGVGLEVSQGIWYIKNAQWFHRGCCF